ncbi:hypothetical protein EJ110_NYTH13162 [Nymphaea thermarum]|nr:hypothetical protein EJ110_NYTH13162 [Nymphaea thermarum]
MEKLQTSQFAKLVLIALFVLLFTPFVSTWMKPPFLFLLLNLLILALGAESGIFTSSDSKAHEEKPTSTTTTTTTTTTIFVSHKEKKDDKLASANDHGRAINSGCEDDAKVVGKPKADKIVKVVRVRSVKKCPSTPSLFFIDDHDDQSKEEEEVGEDDEKTAADELSAQELFFKAESFIGNFYKQLKMQREDSSYPTA